MDILKILYVMILFYFLNIDQLNKISRSNNTNFCLIISIQNDFKIRYGHLRSYS